jgi:hypothetical protein
MADVQITCINKIPRDDPYHAITHLGTATQTWTRQQVVDWIRSAARVMPAQSSIRRNWPGRPFVTV